MARRTRWLDQLADGLIADGAQLSSNLLQTLAMEDRDGSTVTRILLNLWWGAQTGQSSDAWTALDWGIGMVSEDASAAAVLPDPSVNEDSPVGGWLGRGRLMGRFDAGLQSVLGHVFVDLRAQRKLGRVELKLIMDNNQIGAEGAASMRAVWHVRTLVRLP